MLQRHAFTRSGRHIELQTCANITCVSVDNAPSNEVEYPGVASTGDVYYINVTVFLSLVA